MRVSLTHLLWLSCFGAANLAVACTGTVEELGGFEQQQSPASVADGQKGDGAGGSTGSEPSDPSPEQNGGYNDGNQAPNGSAGDDATSSTPGDDSGAPIAAEDAGAVPTPVEDAGPPVDPEAASIERGKGIYPALCAGCHGQDGQGGQVGVSLNESRSFASLANRIDGSMPEGNPGACNRACAEDLARFILATFVN